MDLQADETGIRIHLEAKAGAALDTAEIGRCLDWTARQAETEEQ